MHGTLRFLLAFFVALSHLGVTFLGYNQGVFAVVIFYLLAGMVAYKLILNNYATEPLRYYIDRIKRIFPLYLLVLVFSYCIYLFGASSYFLSLSPTPLSYLSNITIMPLAFYMYSDIDKFMLIPPSWSLGVELQFYLFAPYILLQVRRIMIILVLSLSVYILATMGIIHTDYFGYRLIIGVIFMFLLGVLIQKALQNDQQSKHVLLVIYSVLLFTALYIYIIEFKAPYNHETLFALLFGIPFLYIFTKASNTIKSLRVKITDRYLGSLSYAFFLLHFPTLWMLELFSFSARDILLVLSSTFIFSILFVFIENQLIKKATFNDKTL